MFIIMRKFTYNIIGSNNFWYGSCITNKKDAIAEAKEIISGEDTSFEDGESGWTPEIPERVYIYRWEEIATFDREEEEEEEEHDE